MFENDHPFIRAVSDASSIIIGVCLQTPDTTCFPNAYPTTALWNWKRKCCFH